jgi:hypothetical protein
MATFRRGKGADCGSRAASLGVSFDGGVLQSFVEVAEDGGV